MLGTGLGHYIPLVTYLLFWVMILVSLGGKPLYGLYYAMPFIPYRILRDTFGSYPLGNNLLTILILAVIVGALLRGKRLPKSKTYTIWFVFGVYLYVSMWFSSLMGGAPAPVWLSDINFVTWKDYMMLPLVFVAAGLVLEDRAAIRRVVIVLAICMALIDRTCLLESFSRSWAVFDESKRDPGPLEWGSNQTAAFLAQFGMFFWGFGRVIQRKKAKLICYALVAVTLLATMYTFSRAAYLALLVSIAVLAFLKDRKLLLVLPVFLLTWKVIVPRAVTERVQMTRQENGQLEASAEERVLLWENAKDSFYRSPIIGDGYATFQMGEHVGDLRDTHNWYVLVIVETGIVGALIALLLLVQMLKNSYWLFKHARDPMYTALGLGTFLAVISCLVANCFGDRWTYLEINGLLWIMIAATLRAKELTQMGITSGEPRASVVPSRIPVMEMQ
jgi:putative inorganic carbon (HCO3(-)) transporter